MAVLPDVFIPAIPVALKLKEFQSLVFQLEYAISESLTRLPKFAMLCELTLSGALTETSVAATDGLPSAVGSDTAVPLIEKEADKMSSVPIADVSKIKNERSRPE